MKRFLIVLTIMGAICALGIYELVSVQSVMNTLSLDISNIHSKVIEHEGDITSLSSDINVIKDYWIAHEEYICIMFNHKDLLPITESISRASANIENNNFDDTIIELNLLEEYAKNSAHIMSFHINNIL
ncbi:MAG: DUF4363 family protein [Clostridia bacterium]|nr:DUF4363 family protein [Clostridia bacterium]